MSRKTDSVVLSRVSRFILHTHTHEFLSFLPLSATEAIHTVNCQVSTVQSRVHRTTQLRPMAFTAKSPPVQKVSSPEGSSVLMRDMGPPQDHYKKLRKTHQREYVGVCCNPTYCGRQTCGCTSRAHTGFLHLPSAVLALIFLARRIQPSLPLVDREVVFCVYPRINRSLHVFILFCLFLWKEISQLV